MIKKPSNYVINFVGSGLPKLMASVFIVMGLSVSSCQSPDNSGEDATIFAEVLGDDPKLAEAFRGRASALGVTSAALTYHSGITDDMVTVYHGEGIDENSLFQAASMSKAVAALTILSLAQEHGVALDEDIRPHTPSLNWETINPSDEAVTLQELLSHTAGANVSGFAGYKRGKPLPSPIQIVHGEKTVFHGEVKLKGKKGQFQYSGGGYQIAQVFAQDLSKEPFETAAQRLIFDPLGLDKSTFAQPIDPAKIKPLNIATANSRFRPNEGVFWPMKKSWRNYPEQAAAGLWTTVEDYGLFLQAVILAYNDHPAAVLNSDIVKQALTSVDANYGLGFMLKLTPDGEISYFAHSGANTGYRCSFKADPRTGKLIVTMTNAPEGSVLLGELSRAVFPEVMVLQD